MIKSEQQKNRTIKAREDFKNRLSDISEYSKAGVLAMIGQLEKELEEYEALKRGEFVLPRDITFVELVKNIAKIRIAKGLSQQDLANMLGISKQQINRYEEHDYQNVSLTKISEIIAVLGLTVILERKNDKAA